MLRITFTFFFLSISFIGSSQSASPSDQVSESTVLAGVQAWEVERSDTFILGQRRRASGSILAAIGAGVASIGAVSLVVPLVALGGGLSVVGGIQVVSGSVLVLDATDGVSLAKEDFREQPTASVVAEDKTPRWDPQVIGCVVFFDLGGEAISGRVIKSTFDGAQYRVEYSHYGKIKRKWLTLNDIRSTAEK